MDNENKQTDSGEQKFAANEEPRKEQNVTRRRPRIGQSRFTPADESAPYRQHNEQRPRYSQQGGYRQGGYTSGQNDYRRPYDRNNGEERNNYHNDNGYRRQQDGTDAYQRNDYRRPYNGQRPYQQRNNTYRQTGEANYFQRRRPQDDGQEGNNSRANGYRQDGTYSRRPMQQQYRKPKPSHRPVQPYYEPRPVDPNTPVRLNKYLANAGICSRREADEFIQAGVVTVNGEVATTLGTKVYPTDIIKFHDQLVHSERKVYLLLNKPKDCVTTAEDTHARKTVLDVVKNACSERIYPVGRLDRNTTGVLLLTNDGELAAKLTHPKYEKKKIYHAALDRPLQSDDYEKLMAGVELDGGEMVKADVIEITDENDPSHIGIEIHSGQNRVVRRMFDAVGYKVLRLDRVYFAGLTKKKLPRGKYRFLTPQEVNMLQMGAYE